MPVHTRTMNVSLPRQLQQYVEQLVKTGRYGSASEVVREGLRLMREREAERRERLRALRRSLDESTAQANRGELIPAHQVFREARALIARRRRKSA